MRLPQALNQSIYLLLVVAILSTLAASTLAGCNLIGKKGAGGAKGGAHSTTAANSSNVKALMGQWQISYAVNGDTQSAHVTLTPSPGGFEGTGTDDNNNGPFIVDSGFMAGNSVGFHKRYHVEENPNLPPIVYDGTFEMVTNDTYKGPYMHGNYKLERADGGPSVQGEWDAQKVDAQQAAQNQPPTKEQAPPAPVVDPSKPPELSGKWNAGYEYMFKTFHTHMFLEQDGNKLAGHGADQNTNESYKIVGTYNFPDIKIIHQYPELKLAKNKTKPARTLEFRGKVEVVNEPEYQGPRITGKDIGGGDWMAEEVR
jgi:hypothetical protein